MCVCVCIMNVRLKKNLSIPLFPYDKKYHNNLKKHW